MSDTTRNDEPREGSSVSKEIGSSDAQLQSQLRIEDLVEFRFVEVFAVDRRLLKPNAGLACS